MALRIVSITVTVAAAALVAGSVLAPAAAHAGPPPAAIGAAGAGDPYFPLQGNGGYDVAHYDLSIHYLPATKQLSGHATITATSTQALARFDLDLRANLHASAVTVNGAAATFSQPPARVQELVITPAQQLPAGQTFTVAVDYAGTATPAIDPDGSLDGFIPTSDGAFVASEPQGSPTWFPVNDTPRDKATYAVSVTVPAGLTAVSNGRLVSHRTAGGSATWSWQIGQPISSYLVTATIGVFDVTTGRTAGGVPYFIAVDPAVARRAAPVLARLPEIVDYYSSVYGRYPFGQAGAIVDNARFVGYALETATRPVFDRAPDISTLAHELAHQWYGDTVTLSRWRDIWLNEGFAEFSAWLWDEHTGGQTTGQHLADLLADSDPGWYLPPPGNPGAPDEIFAGSVYDRGAATLAALRVKLGDPTFFRIMRGWLRAHRFGNATVEDFIAYAQQVSPVPLAHFFRDWLYAMHKPSL
ncbi:MAG TPA: M1 family metallopeptidase [Jatrophihabitans sp.]|nr:M1 family metallopeptidase [Jatrophihabitans sp.]